MLRLASIVVAIFAVTINAQLNPDPVLEGAYFYPRPDEVPQQVFVKPGTLITREEPPQLVYHFVADIPTQGLSDKQHVKPLPLASTNVDSKTITISAEPDRKLSKKQNILYVAVAMLDRATAEQTN